MAITHRRPRGQHRRRYSAQRIRRLEGSALLAVSLLAITFATLIPSASRDTDTICVVCGPYAGADAILHVLLFLPVGAALALIGTPWRVALAITVGMATAIELLQLALPVGRVASLADLTSCVAGGMIGLHLARRRRPLLYPRSRAALRYASIGGGAWLLLLLLTGVLLRPSIPGGPYASEWRPALDGVAAPVGRVVSANVAGIPVPDGPVTRPDELRAALVAGMQTDLQAEFGAAASSRITGILRLTGDGDTEILLVAQRGHDLLFRARVLATELRLVTPGVVMAHALEDINLAQPRLIPIEGRRESGALRISAYGREAALPLHSGLGWMFLVRPTSPLMRLPLVGSALWIGLPLFLVGYWTGRRARRKARRAGDAFRMTGTGGEVLAALPALAALVALGLAGVSLALGLTVPDETVWAAAAVALGLGMASGIATALSHDDRAHGVSTASARTGTLVEAPSASSA